MKKKDKRRIREVYKIEIKTLKELGEAHAAALVVLGNVTVPEAVKPLVEKARFLLSEAFEETASEYERRTSNVLNIDHVLSAFLPAPDLSETQLESPVPGTGLEVEVV